VDQQRYGHFNNINYCDDLDLEAGDVDFEANDKYCITCPENSLCRKGFVVGCDEGYFLINDDFCLQNKLIGTFLYNMYVFASGQLAINNGSNICHSQSTF
jgi:hypothetical protein